MKETYKKIGISCLIVLTLFLGWRLYNVQEERNFLQQNVDGAFSAAFSSLYENLFQTASAGGQSELELRDALKTDSALCRTLFTMSSHQNDPALQNIVLTLTQMAPYNGEYPVPTDQTLIDDIGYLKLHLDDEKLTAEVWERLEDAVN